MNIDYNLFFYLILYIIKIVILCNTNVAASNVVNYIICLTMFFLYIEILLLLKLCVFNLVIHIYIISACCTGYKF